MYTAQPACPFHTSSPLTGSALTNLHRDPFPRTDPSTSLACPSARHCGRVSSSLCSNPLPSSSSSSSSSSRRCSSRGSRSPAAPAGVGAMQGRPGKAAIALFSRAQSLLLGPPSDMASSLGMLQQGCFQSPSEKLPGSFLSSGGSSPGSFPSRRWSSRTATCSAVSPSANGVSGGSASATSNNGGGNATSGMPEGSSPARIPPRGPGNSRAASRMVAPTRVVRTGASSLDMGATYDNYQQGGAGVYQAVGQLYVSHTFYKGKAALAMEPKRPQFQALANGGYKLAREGVVFLKFTHAIGSRQYDWQNSKLFALSVGEMGRLVELERNQGVEFFHDPFMNDSRAKGKVSKVLRVDPITDGPGGYFFNLSVRNELDRTNDKISVSMSHGEFSIMRSALKFFIPYGLGWGAFCDPSTMLPSMIGEDEGAMARGGGDRDNWS